MPEAGQGPAACQRPVPHPACHLTRAAPARGQGEQGGGGAAAQVKVQRREATQVRRQPSPSPAAALPQGNKQSGTIRRPGRQKPGVPQRQDVLAAAGSQMEWQGTEHSAQVAEMTSQPRAATQLEAACKYL